VLTAIIRALETNLFRCLPPRVHNKMIDPEDDDEVYYSNWDYLKGIYEFFLQFLVVSSFLEKKQVLKDYLDMRFMARVLDLFDTEDGRERNFLRVILIRVYSKAMRLRAPIRLRMSQIFHEFTYVTERHNGIIPMLEVLGGIITGFVRPIKEQHKVYLKKVLLPMHKVRCLSAVHSQLSYCITQFVDKDHTLAVPVIKGLIKFWPVTGSAKEILLLNELEEVLELTQETEFEEIMKILSQRIAKCINSPHFQVSQRTLLFWQNDYLSRLFAQYQEQMLPALYPALLEAREHWNSQVVDLSDNVLTIFSRLDMEGFEKVAEEYKDLYAKNEARRKHRLEDWTKLEKSYRKKPSENKKPSKTEEKNKKIKKDNDEKSSK